MERRASLARTLVGQLDWRGALREPRTWGIVARHMVPVAGVVMLGWSGIQAISVVALDTLAGLWGVVAVASILAAREKYDADARDLYEAIITGLLVFGIVAGLLTFAVAVVAFVLAGSVLARADLDPSELLEQGWVFYAFGGLLVLHAPHTITILATTTGKTAKSVLEPRVGFLLRRLILAGMACSFLSVLWGRAAVFGALVVSQLVLAAHEVFGDRLHAVLFPESVPKPSPPPKKMKRRK